MPQIAAAPYGLGIWDFNRPGQIRVSDAYRQKQKHIDIYAIGESTQNYLRFPSTFDGRLPSESFGRQTSRVLIGETYFFPEVGEEGMTGTVTAATVCEERKEMLIGVTDRAGQSYLLRGPMSDADLEEYKEFDEAYFGEVLPGPRNPKDYFELFEWFMAVHKDASREKIVEWLAGAPDLEQFEQLGDDDFRIAYCEALVADMQRRESRPSA